MSNPCEQHEKIKHIEADLTNHRVWRKETSTQLTDIYTQLATLNERLKSKMETFDDHVKDGNAFRTTLLFTLIGLIVTACSGFVTYGKLEQKVDFIYTHSKGVQEVVGK